MRRSFTPAEKPYILPAIVQGSVFAASFLITTAVTAHVALHRWPSTSTDDVRTDLFLPVYGAAYVVSCLLSYLSGKLILGKRLTARTHLRFALWVPFFFVLTYVIIAELAVGFQNGPVDRGIMYCAFFASMSIGYFCILTPWREINR